MQNVFTQLPLRDNGAKLLLFQVKCHTYIKSEKKKNENLKDCVLEKEELSHRGLATTRYFTAHQADDFCSSMGASAGSLARCPCPSEYSLTIWQTLKRYDILAN